MEKIKKKILLLIDLSLDPTHIDTQYEILRSFRHYKLCSSKYDATIGNVGNNLFTII